MKMFNAKGITFLQRRTRPLEINDIETAGARIAEALEKATNEGRPLDATLGRHLAWLIGFDTLLEDRAAIHNLVDKLGA
jgi:hypothetical protein